VAALSPYLDESGWAHTFADPSFGTWAWAHADVTPAAGLALMAGRGPSWAVELLRDACLAARESDGTWLSFWWTTDAYAVALNLEFLDASGGIPADAAEAIRDWLAVVPAAASAFESAQLVATAALVAADAREHVSELVARQRHDGGWPASAVLLVPSQETGAPGAGQADVRRLLTTATASDGDLRARPAEVADVNCRPAHPPREADPRARAPGDREGIPGRGGRAGTWPAGPPAQGADGGRRALRAGPPRLPARSTLQMRRCMASPRLSR
jgi:hypothetical protein